MNKVNHGQAANAASPYTQTSTRDSKKHTMNHQAAPQSFEQGIVCDLSSMPTTSNNRSPYTTLGPETMDDKLAPDGSILRKQSNRSSICRSPGWEDSNKRRKEKQEAKDIRRREKKSAVMEAKEIRQASRLTKAPPTSKGQSRLSASLPHTDSAPIFQTSHNTESAGLGKLGHKRDWKSNGAASRTDMPRNSTHDQAGDEAERPEVQGFIGGLKLQQSSQAVAQQTFRTRKPSVVEPHKSNFVEEFTTVESTASKADFLQDDGRALLAPDSNAPEENKQRSGACVSSAAGRSRGRKQRPSGSESTVPKSDVSNGLDPGDGQSLKQKIEATWLGRRPKRSTAISPERPPISYREPAQLAETRPRSRRGSFSSLLGLKQPTKEVVTEFSQEGPHLSSAASSISTRNPRGRSWSFSKSSRTFMSRPTTTDSFISVASRPGITDEDITHRNGLTSSPGTASSSKESLSLHGKLSMPSQLQGITAVARAAFSKFPISPRSSSRPRNSIEASGAEGLRPDSIIIPSRRHEHSPAQSPIERATPVDPEALVFSGYDTQTTSTIRGSKPSSSSDSSDEYHSLLDEKGAVSMIATSAAISYAANGNDSVTHLSNSAPSNRAKGGDMDVDKDSNPKEFKSTADCLASTNSTPNTDAHDLSFLPPLRHRTLRRPVKGKAKEVSSNNCSNTLRQNPSAPLKGTPPPTPPRSSSSSSASLPISSSNVTTHSARHLHNQRQNLPSSAHTSRVSLATTNNQEANTKAKMFVICCNCRYFHDMPSKVYECMAKPDNVVRDPDLGVSGVISTRVKCPWCAHGMSTTCCEGWAAVVVMKERLH